jgi:hypothetical protein
MYSQTALGKRRVTLHVSDAAHAQLRALAADRRMSGEALMQEALRNLFRNYGKPPII